MHRHIRFDHNVNGLSFDENAGVWTATTSKNKRFRARTVVLASGPLSDASFPDIRGIDSYRGHKIHSARWDHDYDFTGKRVGVIGTGASAIQIVPELVKQAKFVKVFQRTPGWVLPRLDFPTRSQCKNCLPKSLQHRSLPGKRCFGARGQRHSASVEYTADLAGRETGEGASAAGRQRPVAAPATDSRLRAGVQTYAGLQRLLPSAATRQLQAHRLADRHS
ncbi:pyridine nucleotide-disulfide oxidoreductase family protein [Mycobacterium xenopi 4042]|uniref:Pyridine nucleotide-disulfide oxidoreductase family protein n=1 Tax=Mycobacterium xenopi 4042 TaxID=1299334 RepID=X8AP08_MYCXE|nr:pyridine nucleotide-disulfide oxidoreductase family protein [Mycobacterium xenopi 4042]